MTKNSRAKVKADALDNATGLFLDTNKSPARNVNKLDNRGSHFYLAMYWAQELAKQSMDRDLQAKFAPIAASLLNNETKIVDELNSVQGNAVDIEGYYAPNTAKTVDSMRPSSTLNDIINAI